MGGGRGGDGGCRSGDRASGCGVRVAMCFEGGIRGRAAAAFTSFDGIVQDTGMRITKKDLVSDSIKLSVPGLP